MPILTKSKYLNGLQCPKLIWITFHDPGKIPPVDPATQFIFDQGHAIGNLAKKVYPLGIDILYNEFNESIKQTKELLSQRKALFEASISAGNLYARVDILNPAHGGGWDIVEVKSSTSVKDANIFDVAFQKYCCQQSGLTIRKCYLMHVDNTYVRQGEIDPEGLFTVEDVSDQVNQEFPYVEEKVERILKTIAKKTEPVVTIGPFCETPYECPLKERCWSFLPDKNIFELYWGGQKAFGLFSQGVERIEDIPDMFPLNPRQMIQKKAIEENKAQVDKEGIANFLSSMKLPLYFLDFETINPAIPLFDGTRPFQKIPFQFSLHVISGWTAPAGHHMFLAEGANDPRPEFLRRLKAVIGESGSVVVYNQSFEEDILRDLAVNFCEHQGWIDNVIERMVDLLTPFRSFHYHHPDQKGSASIKSVLPVLTGSGYEGMAISEGGTASQEFYRVTYKCATEEDRRSVRKNLEEYCSLDTQAMMDIVQELRKLV